MDIYINLSSFSTFNISSIYISFRTKIIYMTKSRYECKFLNAIERYIVKLWNERIIINEKTLLIIINEMKEYAKDLRTEKLVLFCALFKVYSSFSYQNFRHTKYHYLIYSHIQTFYNYKK